MSEDDGSVEAAGEDKDLQERYTGDNVRASWPFSLHTIRANIAHCSPEGKETLVAAFLWCTDDKHPISRDEFASRVNYSANVIYKLLSGKYLHPTTKQKLDVPPKLIAHIRQFLKLERDRAGAAKGAFVVTPTAQRIFTACDLARESQTPVFVIGPSHIGKTWALERYKDENNHGRTVYVRMKAASGLGGMVRRIAHSVGVSDKSNTANLVDYIKNALTKDMLLILDEMHLLSYTYRRAAFFACMEVIREIYDEVECGMVLCATKLLQQKMKEGQNGEMEQVLRRGVHRLILPDPTPRDLELILSHWKLGGLPKKTLVVKVQGIEERPYDILKTLAHSSGLKAITERLRYGRRIATRHGKNLAWDHFVEAHLTIAQEAQPDDEWEEKEA